MNLAVSLNLHCIKPTIKAQTVKFVKVFHSCSNGYYTDHASNICFQTSFVVSLAVSNKFEWIIFDWFRTKYRLLERGLLSVLLTLVTKPHPLYSTRESLYEISQNPKWYLVRNLAKSQTISCTKSCKIPNDISYKILQNPKRDFVRDFVSSRAHINILLCMRLEISYKISQIKQCTKQDKTISWKVFFFPTTAHILLVGPAIWFQHFNIFWVCYFNINLLSMNTFFPGWTPRGPTHKF